MASLALAARQRRPLMAWTALLKADLAALSKSWLVRGWVAALALAEFFVLTSTLIRARVTPVPASQVLAGQLNGFLLVWSTVIIVLSAGSIAADADVISDSLLCRACTRIEFILSKLAARLIAVLGIYALSAGIAAYCAWRYAANDMTSGTMLSALLVVALALALLVALGLAVGVVVDNAVVAVTGVLLLWYVASPVFSFLGADYLSPASLVRNLPLLLKDPNAPQIVRCTATRSTLTLTFSKELDPLVAEDPARYVVEVPPGVTVTPQAATYDPSRTAVVLSGLALGAGESVTVSANDVTDRGGNAVNPAAATVTARVPGQAARVDASTAKAAPAKPVPAKPAAARARVIPEVTGCTATPSSLTVAFSSALDPADAEEAANYVVESPRGTPVPVRTASYSSGTRTVLLSGLRLSLDTPVSVTVKEVRSAAGVRIGGRNTATYSKVTTWKYLLGFGAPALVLAILTTAWFSRRDL